jgi:hypothetical protein
MSTSYYAPIPKHKVLVYVGNNLDEGMVDDITNWIDRAQADIDNNPDLDEMTVKGLTIRQLHQLVRGAEMYLELTWYLYHPRLLGAVLLFGDLVDGPLVTDYYISEHPNEFNGWTRCDWV